MCVVVDVVVVVVADVGVVVIGVVGGGVVDKPVIIQSMQNNECV